MTTAMVQNETHVLYNEDVQSLHRTLPVGLRINTLVRRAARRGGMGRDHLLIKSERGIINGQRPSMELSLAPSAVSAWLAQRKRKTRHLQRTFFASGFFFLLPSIIPAPPWSIKGKAGHPTREIDSTHHASHHT